VCAIKGDKDSKYLTIDTSYSATSRLFRMSMFLLSEQEDFPSPFVCGAAALKNI
jgi:hypothetical protein